MRLLVIGGTLFLGRHIVEAALARGHEVTLFNRGKTNPDVYPELEKLRGDRHTGDFAALEGRTWDAAIDTNGYVPKFVRGTAEALRDKLTNNGTRYVFISSISVYSSEDANDENAPVSKIENEDTEEITGETYGALKYLCERAVESVFPGQTLNVRAGFIIGKYDRVYRLPYWAERIARGGDILAPRTDFPLQLIDARDIAEWIMHCLENGIAGDFNVTNVPAAIQYGEMLQTLHSAIGSEATFTHVDDEFLAQHEVRPDQLPYWLPIQYINAHHTNVDKARAAGLTLRPFELTAREVADWVGANPFPDQFRQGIVQSGLSPEKEREMLAAWKSAAKA
jgi:2'-hydroxyisoflavone reductase